MSNRQGGFPAWLVLLYVMGAAYDVVDLHVESRGPLPCARPLPEVSMRFPSGAYHYKE